VCAPADPAIHHGGRALGDAIGIRGNPERSHPVVNMDVNVHQTGSDDLAPGIDAQPGFGGGNRLRDPGDAAVANADVANRRQALRRIDYAAAVNQQIEGGTGSLPSRDNRGGQRSQQG